jgi:protein phosphatase
LRYTYREFYRDRDSYADRLFFSSDTFAVADGMGTLQGSRCASQKAVEMVDRYRPFRDLSDLNVFFQRINRKIMQEVAKLGDESVSGTTLSLLAFNGNNFLVGHVGDSRIYLLRDGGMELLTEDQIRLRGGKKYVSALGLEWSPPVLLYEDSVLEGDRFLLISDGAVDRISDEEVKDILSIKDLEKSADALMDTYITSEPEDDLSFIIVQV